MRKLKIAICIPVYGMTHAKFTQSLANMIVHSLGAELRDAAPGSPAFASGSPAFAGAGGSGAGGAGASGAGGEAVKLELETFMVSCSMLTESRHRLVAEALAWEADYMLCLDADHVFPPDTLMRLLAHDLPVVGANYPRRFTPTAPTAAIRGQDGDDRTLLYTTREDAECGLVEPVAHLGFGVLLIDMRVFDALQAKAEADGEAGANFLPLFKFEPTANKVGMIGEDVFFFDKLAEAGIRPFVDHRLSWEVGHLFEMVLTNGHAVAQRDAWAEHQRTKAAKFARKAEEIEARAGEAVGQAPPASS